MNLSKFYISILSAVFVSGLAAESLIKIFPSNPVRRPQAQGCKCQAIHGLKLDEEKKVISWTWSNKMDCFCGWQFDGLPNPNLKALENACALKIEFSGQHTGTDSPKVRFIDTHGTQSDMIEFNTYLVKDDPREKMVMIPLKAFSLSNLKDPTKITKLQFEGGWNSTSGDIKIYSVQIVDLRVKR